MSAVDRPAGRRRPAYLLHLVGALGVPGSLLAGGYEYQRARAGNQLSWGYTVEWPLIAGCGVYLWVKLVRERREAAGGTTRVVRAGEGGPSGDDPTEPVDPGLVAWQDYVARLQAADPPGGPPGR
jgi:hypothetical protein